MSSVVPFLLSDRFLRSPFQTKSTFLGTDRANNSFVIASLERTDPAQDDATYSISLENDGVVEFDESAITDSTPQS